ncbi:hypothetical protein AMAG_19446 [Allomyces macrogynus ATCC 38327]|uniref:Uncharacterized protein n=1 Tax=Allomyces macrogynus (strain ATCC 38327) TaxID=578462 RepID=A0A0L0SRP8_ALLM3|nr:hypothetical protein AMAG_19446 [Allomyces macrogynus ATCC 38327]|eukprot:KNE65238.1 hypothetical protein AMAG_19446 [Allomyces macrogynus ATCC 38327]
MRHRRRRSRSERLLRIRESAPPGPNLLDDPTGEHALVVADAPLAPLAVLPMTEAEHQALATGNIHPEGVGKKPDTSTSQTRPGAARAVPGRAGSLTAAPTNPAALRGRRIDRPASISSAPGSRPLPGAGTAPGSRPGRFLATATPV